MWRALFLAVGTYLVLLGAQCLFVQKFVLKAQETVAVQSSTSGESSTATRKKEMNPPPWAPWSLMSSGVVTCIYSFTVPARVKK